MKIVADMHTHTIASGHAYSTVNELAREAAEKGLEAIALTDHGPAIPGGPHPYHFGAMRFIPPHLFGVRVFRGVEANIVNAQGEIDLSEWYLEKLDFVLAGLHEGCSFDGRSASENTAAVINAMNNRFVRAISHPGNPVFPLHVGEVVKAAVATGTALEINNSSFSLSRRGSRPNCEALAKLVAREGALVIVGSDAHIAHSVGSFEDALQVLVEAGVTESQVVNSSMPRLLSFLGLEH